MGTVLLLARRTWRRQRLQILTTALLVTVAAILMNLGVICATDYPAAQRETARRLHTADLQVQGTNAAAMAEMARLLRADPAVTQVREREAAQAWVSFTYNGAPTSTNLAFVVPDQHADLGRTQIVAEASERYPDPVWLPYVFRVGGGYSLGDPFTVTTAQGSRTFRVQGFTENLYLGMMTMGLTGVGVTPEQLAGLRTGPTALAGATFLDVRLSDPGLATEVSGRATSQVKAAFVARGLEPPAIRSDPYTLVESGAMVGPNLYAASLVAFALIIALVVVVVVRFLIRSAVLQDSTALGTLAAAGASVPQTLAGIALPMAGMALVGAVAGVALSYAVLPLLAASLVAQAGIGWAPGVSFPGAAVAIGVLTATALVTAVLAGRGVRRVAPVQAVRGGQDGHSFRRTLLALDRTRGALDVLLGLKQAVQHPSQNVLVAVVIALVTFAGMFSAALYTNVLGSRTAFTRLLVGDVAPVQIQVRDPQPSAASPGQRRELRDQLLAEVTRTPGVSKAFYVDNRGAAANGTPLMLAVTEDFARQDYSSIYQGRAPQHDNEVAIGGRVAERIGTSVGDTITLEVGASTRDYLVTGLISTVNYVGMRADLTTAGYRRMVPAYQPDYLAVYLDPGVTVADLRGALSPAAAGRIAAINDSDEVLGSQIDVYMQMAGYLAAGILIGTAVVIALVMGLVTATMLIRNRRSLGVRKALGFTSGQLVLQTVLTHLPVVLLGVVLGAGAGLLLVEPALVALLRTVGLMSLSLGIPPYVVAGLALAVLALATALIVAQAGRIRRITPYSLFQEV